MLGPEEQLPELLRGVVELHQLEDLRERLALGRPLRIKAGFDPTRPDLHFGHAVPLQKLRQFQDLGHHILFLIGDFTALVGDPTGKNEARPRLTRAEVDSAARTYQEQAFKILDRERTEVRFNSEWLSKLGLEDVVSLCAQRTVARTLDRRDFRERFEAQKDIYLHEFLYPLLQAYDSVALECDVEIGGTDQLFNLMAGRDLMGRRGLKPQIVLTMPLLEGLDARLEDGVLTGKKMSKSEGNAIGLTEPPLEMYRKCMQIHDALIWRAFELLSSRSKAELDELAKGQNPLEAKALFAGEMLTRFHGATEAAAARADFERSYLGGGLPEEIPEKRLSSEGEPVLLAKALALTGLVTSIGEGRRLVQQGGVEVDSVRVTDGFHKLAPGRRYLLRAGSKQRRFCYLELA